MRKTFLSSLMIIFCWLAVPLHAQQLLKFEVAEFKQDPYDLSARSDHHKKEDSSGSLYAIIKVKTDVENDDLSRYIFDFGLMSSLVEVHDDLQEIWVYVQKNAKRITIKREGYRTIDKHSLGTTIAAGNTYVMKLIVHTPVVQHRILQFKVSPANEGAIVKVKREESDGEYEVWETDASGSADRRLEVGKYVYEVAAENYETTVGSIVLAYDKTNYVENVTLKPNFGWLEINDTYGTAGAQIYVNNKKIGTIPYKSNDRWEARDNYHLMITAGEMYKTYHATFSITKGEVTKLDPRLESDFAKTTLTVDGDEKADIYINDERRGTGSWNGPLKAGTYTVECRRERHRSTTTQIVVKPDKEETFMLAAPIPITGTVYVTTKPTGARVYLDNVEKGISPVDLTDVIIGQHQIKVVLDNYKTETQQVEVKENSTTEARFELHDFALFNITSNPDGAQLVIDGKSQGLTPCQFDGTSGLYDIRISKKGYLDYHQQVRLNSSAPNLDIALRKLYQRPSCSYVQLGMLLGSVSSAFGTFGLYMSNFNVECSAYYGVLTKGQDIYWSRINSEERPKHSIYKPNWGLGGKVGYGITFGTMTRLTPQVGMTVFSISDSESSSNASFMQGSIGLRADFALYSSFGLFVTPEYNFPLWKSDVYSRIADIHSDIKGWSTGLGLRLGLSYSF